MTVSIANTIDTARPKSRLSRMVLTNVVSHTSWRAERQTIRRVEGLHFTQCLKSGVCRKNLAYQINFVGSPKQSYICKLLEHPFQIHKYYC